MYRLPQAVPELVVVAGHFHLKPLIPLLAEDSRFYVLALSQDSVQLYRGTPHSLHRVEVAGIPLGLSEVVAYDDPERHVQLHTGAPPAGQRRGAILHGHGAGAEKDIDKENLLRYFQQVDSGLHAYLGKERAPLVLAGVEYLLPIYRQANTYAQVVDGGVTGNPEGLGPHDLHAQAWLLVEPVLLRSREEAIALYHELAGTGLASNDLVTILPAAHDGRVQTVFVSIEQQRWGSISLDPWQVHLDMRQDPGDEDLLDVAASETLVHGGTVFALPPELSPDGQDSDPIAAIFRY